MKNECIAYVDGSFNSITKTYGYGVVIIDDDKIIKELSGFNKQSDLVSMRNVAGEIKAAEAAIEEAITLGYGKITIFYDYQGIECWANGTWKAHKKGTILYKKFINEKREKIEISFTKVKAHSGIFYNEKADNLAKKAAGVL